jgi:hypothetical protein
MNASTVRVTSAQPLSTVSEYLLETSADLAVRRA